MNERKDIFESVKYIMKEEIETKINCSKLARCRDCSVLLRNRQMSQYFVSREIMTVSEESDILGYILKIQILQNKLLIFLMISL